MTLACGYLDFARLSAQRKKARHAPAVRFVCQAEPGAHFAFLERNCHESQQSPHTCRGPHHTGACDQTRAKNRKKRTGVARMANVRVNSLMHDFTASR